MDDLSERPRSDTVNDQLEPHVEKPDRPPSQWSRLYFAPLVFVRRMKLDIEENDLLYPEPKETTAEETAERYFPMIEAIKYEGMVINSTEIRIQLRTKRGVMLAAGHPLEFRSNVPLPLRYLSEENREAFCVAVDTIWNSLVEEFLELVRDGGCRVLARIGTPTAPRFSEILPDAFEHFDVTDWHKGVAEEKSGHRLYSIHVTPVGSIPAQPLAPPSGFRAQKRARATNTLRALYPGGIPRPDEVSNVELIKAVDMEMRAKGLEPVGGDTILRAAGRTTDRRRS